MKRFFRMPYVIVITFLLALTSCGMVSPIEFVGVDNIVIKQGSSIVISADAVLYNPNQIKFRVISHDLDIYVEGQPLGKLKLADGLHIGKKERFETPLEIKIGLMELLGTGANLLPKLFAREFEVQVKGEITVKAFLFKRRMDVHFIESVKL